MAELPVRLSRRMVLAGAVAGLAGCSRPGRDTPLPVPAPGRPADFATPAAFAWVAGQVLGPGTEETPDLTNDGGRLSWGTAYLLQAWLAMYQATGEVHHLEQLVERGEQVLAVRDNERGVVDYRGRSGPVWSASQTYTACWRDLADEAGTPVLRLRSLAKGDQVLCSVRPAGAGFDLSVVAGPDGPSEEMRSLSCDPASPDYVVTRLRAAAPTPAELTVEDLRPAGAGNSVLRADGGLMEHYRYAFAAHSGMIVAPLVAAAVVVTADGGLRRRFGSVAQRFVRAGQDALATHDNQWTAYDSGAVYAFERGAPVRGDGTPLPHNQYLAAARAHMHLARAVAEPVHANRARQMLRVFWSDLGPGAAPVWPYYWSAGITARGYDQTEDVSSFSPTQPPYRNLEDTSHGTLDVECVALGHALGLGGANADLRRLAASFLRHIARTTASGQAIGAESLAAGSKSGRYDESVPRWSVLAPWDRRVWDFGRRLFDERLPAELTTVTLASIAALVRQR